MWRALLIHRIISRCLVWRNHTGNRPKFHKNHQLKFQEFWRTTAQEAHTNIIIKLLKTRNAGKKSEINQGKICLTLMYRRIQISRTAAFLLEETRTKEDIVKNNLSNWKKKKPNQNSVHSIKYILQMKGKLG